MSLPKISVLISYSSTERYFIVPQLKQCLLFAHEIIVTMGTRRFDGEHETVPDCVSEFPNVRWIIYDVDLTKPIDNPLQHRKDAYWHNISRMAAFSSVSKESEWILFLDGDEIPDGELFRDWLSQTPLYPECSYKLANYWYFRDPYHRARAIEDSVLLIHRSHIPSVQVLMQDFERDGIAFLAPKGPRRNVQHLKHGAMFSHFSWARPKQDILRKVRAWGHRDDRPWEQLIEQIWDGEFPETDFVHGYRYDVVPNFFQIQWPTEIWKK